MRELEHALSSRKAEATRASKTVHGAGRRHPWRVARGKEQSGFRQATIHGAARRAGQELPSMAESSVAGRSTEHAMRFNASRKRSMCEQAGEQGPLNKEKPPRNPRGFLVEPLAVTGFARLLARNDAVARSATRC